MESNLDERNIIGTWSGGADDGSGLRTMIYNFGIKFYEDGTGITFNWNSDQDGYHEQIEKIVWEKLNDNTIKIKILFDDNVDEEMDVINYEISDFIGAYSSEYFKLVEKGKDEFWLFPEPIYKHKTILRKNLFVELWNDLKFFFNR